MRRACLVVLLLVARASPAAIYESPITAEDEDDLLAAQERGELSPESTERLIDLINVGVDLNTATRDELYELPGLGWREVDAILEYRKLKGRIEDPAELVGAEAVSADALLQMAPFIRLEPATEILPIGGKMKLITGVSLSDSRPPPFYFAGAFKGPWNLSAGIELATTRFLPTAPVYDPVRDTLQVEGPYYSLHMPKLYGQWKAGNRRIIVGSFRVGFAEQLTLDTTLRKKPRGFDVTSRALSAGIWSLSNPCRYATGELSESPCPSDGTIAKGLRDFSWRDVFRGIAASIEDLELGENGPRLSLYGFGSFQTRKVYQYQIVDRRNCADPRDDESNDLCDAPDVYVKQADPSAPYPTLRSSTLPGVLNELVFGGHGRLQPVPRFYFGITGYGAIPLWNVPQMELDFQEWARTPWNGPYGAIGLDGKVTVGPMDLFAEVTRTFNRIPDERGGWGAILRGLVNPKGHQLEWSVRLYDPTFSNPYSSPVSSPDISFGQRARNELGLKLDYVGKLPADLFVRAWVNFWMNPWRDDDSYFNEALGAEVIPSDATLIPAFTPNLHGRARLDWKGFWFLNAAAWFDYRNNDLGNSATVINGMQTGACYSGGVDGSDPEGFGDTIYLPAFNANGEPLRCTGELYRVSAALTLKPLREKLGFWLQGYHTWVSQLGTNTMRMDDRIWVEVRSNLLDRRLTLRARLSYTFFDIANPDPDRHNDFFWGVAEVAGRPWPFLRPALRYDVRVYNDQRPADERRNPNPEHMFRLVVDAKF